MLAKTYHAIIPRRLAAGLCQMAIPSTPGSIVPPPFMEASQGLQWDMLLRQG